MTERHTVFDFPWAPVPEALLYDAAVSPTAVRIWGTLARYGLTPDSCFPSHEEVAARLGMSARSVARPIAELEEQGWLRRFPRFNERGRTSDGYELLARKFARENPADLRATPRAESRGEREPLERDTGDSLRSSPPARTNARPAVVVAFDEFWSIYPRKTGKGAARKAWDRATKKAEPGVILAAARVFAEDPNLPRDEPQFIPHPSTWLNQERWEDGPLPPREGRRQTPTQRTIANLSRLLPEGGSRGNNGSGAPKPGATQRGLSEGGR